MIERPSATKFHTFSHDPFVLVGGTVHDPKNGINGSPSDIWVESGRIVSTPNDPTRFRRIDTSGLIVMPGGVDLHSLSLIHI